MLYTIHIPGAIYTGLQERDAFENDNDIERKASRVFKSAQRIKVNSGFRYILTGERPTLVYILDYIHSLAELIGTKGLSITRELRASRMQLLTVANQQPVPVKEPS